MTAIETIGRKKESKTTTNRKQICPNPFNDKRKLYYICLHLLLIRNNLNIKTILKRNKGNKLEREKNDIVA